MDANNFSKTDFHFPGIYRGVVEDNADDLDMGRVKIRVYEIHNLDGVVTPIEQLPWAEPALGLSWSGGYNIYNQDHQNQAASVPGQRYDPGSNSDSSGPKKSTKDAQTPNDTKFSPEVYDPLLNSYGTGGQFVVPKRGNWVFVFFQAGHHMKPVYFAMAPVGRDWITQKIQRNLEITQKVKQINGFRDEFTPRKKSEPKDKDTWAPTTIVNSLVDKPQIKIDEIDQKDSNRDITCTTSAQGTTIIVDNRLGKERVYVIHKNFIDYVDESGNKKLYAGKSRGAVPPGSLDPNVPSNFEIGVEGNHEVFVLGDYNLYSKGNTNIQVDGDAQIDVYKNVGIVSRTGDVDVIIEKGNLNADIKGNADINVGDNANIHIKNDANVLVDKNMKVTVNGDMDAIVKGSAKVEVDGSLNATIKGSVKVNALSTVEITCPDVRISGNVSVGGQLNVTGDISTAGGIKVQQVAFVTGGIDCGGYIRNRGLVDLGGPCTLHNLMVLGGQGSGTGRGANPVTSPTTPDLPTAATHEAGPTVNKDNLKTKTTPNEKDPPSA